MSSLPNPLPYPISTALSRAVACPVRCAAFAAVLAFASAAATAGSKAHEHGVVKLDVAIDGSTLTLALESPLDSLLGFERAPRNDKERRAASELLARMRSDTGLFSTEPGAQCSLTKREVQAPVLESDAKDAKKSEHADLNATFSYTCAQPQQLRALDVGLFQAFSRIQRIDVQVAAPKGQSKTTLTRPARAVVLQK